MINAYLRILMLDFSPQQHILDIFDVLSAIVL